MAVTTGSREFYIVAGPEFHRVALALDEVDVELGHEFRKKLQDAVKPAIDEAKQKVENMQVRGRSGTTGLRQRVAAGVTVLEGGLGDDEMIRVETTMPSPNQAIIPRGLDRASGWRHPVYGHMDNWVTETAVHPGWFRDTIASHKDDMEQALTNVLEWARDKIATAGGTPHPGA